ncbi:hypothetical protein F5B22DRAFT_188422 [Xylaria bambusicola]|uniref:uncharacterized protein n=1 Tax=Xylaria bambusicola TaxID=326684 RepID=UPI002007F82F|nr:uncharacterized protein F5B22DRAFT_188422 [Xylaria bambusicola]KAI0515392.1 hypothetical protein F5B22DRAFT_188422 [Xylaria bambusicola]
MFTKPGQIDLSRLSLDSLSMEQPLEQDDSDIELSYSEKSNRLVAKRYFQFYHQTIADIRQSPINLTPWIFSMIFFAAAYMIVAKLRFFGALNTSYCSPDGSIKPVYTNLWATSDLFQVNIATGNLTFTQAKVIDTIWDLIVGRGGQATLTLITWKLFAEYAAVSMAIQPVTFATYRILFTDSGPSISSTASLLYDFIKFRGLASKWASAFLIYSIMLSLAFPTLAGSTTGYTTLNEAFIHTDDNNLIPISSPSWGDMTNPNETYESVIRRQGVCVPVKDVGAV